jgi:hypothetical protein
LALRIRLTLSQGGRGPPHPASETGGVEPGYLCPASPWMAAPLGMLKALPSHRTLISSAARVTPLDGDEVTREQRELSGDGDASAPTILLADRGQPLPGMLKAALRCLWDASQDVRLAASLLRKCLLYYVRVNGPKGGPSAALRLTPGCGSHLLPSKGYGWWATTGLQGSSPLRMHPLRSKDAPARVVVAARSAGVMGQSLTESTIRYG